jgi:hypothetical protein
MEHIVLIAATDYSLSCETFLCNIIFRFWMNDVSHLRARMLFIFLCCIFSMVTFLQSYLYILSFFFVITPLTYGALYFDWSGVNDLLRRPSWLTCYCSLLFGMVSSNLYHNQGAGEESCNQLLDSIISCRQRRARLLDYDEVVHLFMCKRCQQMCNNLIYTICWYLC